MSEFLYKRGKSQTINLYVSPTGTGEGFTSSDPADLFDVLDNRLQNTGYDAIYIKCLPGTYDFSTRGVYYLPENTIIGIYGNDPSNPPIFTRAAGSGQNINWLFTSRKHSYLLLGYIIFDKWVDGSATADTDIPRVVALEWQSTLVLDRNIEIRGSKNNYSDGVSPFYLHNGSPTMHVYCTKSYYTVTFNALGSNSSDSTYTAHLIHNNSDGNVYLGTWEGSAFELKMHGLGDWFIPFYGRNFITPQDGNSITVKFDKIYRLADITNCLGKFFVVLINQGYNNDGTVNASAVGGVDYYVKSILFQVSLSSITINVALNSDVYLNADTSHIAKFCYMLSSTFSITFVDNGYKFHCSENNGTSFLDFRFSNGVIHASDIITVDSGISMTGIYSFLNSIATLYFSVIDGNSLTTYGVNSYQASHINIWTTTISNCTTGIKARENSHVTVYNATYSGNTNNESADVGSSIVT